MCWLKDVADHVSELSWIEGPRRESTPAEPLLLHR
jgi:hypothetical protein